MALNHLNERKSQRKALKSEHCGIPICPVKKNTTFCQFTSKSVTMKSEPDTKSLQVNIKLADQNKAITSSVRNKNFASTTNCIKKSSAVDKDSKNKSSIVKSLHLKPVVALRDNKAKSTSSSTNRWNSSKQTTGVELNKNLVKKRNGKAECNEMASGSASLQKNTVKKENPVTEKCQMNDDKKCEAEIEPIKVTDQLVDDKFKPNAIRTERKVYFNECHAGTFHTPHSSKRFIYRDMKHSGVFITPKLNKTPYKLSVRKMPKTLPNDDINRDYPDASAACIETLSSTDEIQNSQKDAQEQTEQSTDLIKTDQQQLSSSAVINVTKLTSVMSDFDEYSSVCETLDREYDEEVVRSYEEMVHNYEMYCDDLLKLFYDVLTNAELSALTAEEQQRAILSAENDDNKINAGNLNDIVDKVQNVVRIIGGNVDRENNNTNDRVDAQLLNDCDGFISNLKKQKSVLEGKLIRSNDRYNLLQERLETTTSDAIQNVITFEKTAIACLNFLQRQIEIEKYENVRRLSVKDEQIVRLKNTISGYRLQLQEFEDDITLLQAEKENLEDVIKCRSEQTDSSSKRIKFSRILTELTFSARHVAGLDPAYRNFYLRFFEFMHEIKLSVTSLKLDFYLSLPTISTCLQCSSLSSSSSSWKQSQIKMKNKPSSSSYSRPNATSNEVENVLKLVNLLTDKIKRSKFDDNNNKDDGWKQLLSSEIAAKIDDEDRVKLMDAYSELMKQLSELKISHVVSSPESIITTSSTGMVYNNEMVNSAKTGNYTTSVLCSTNNASDIFGIGNGDKIIEREVSENERRGRMENLNYDDGSSENLKTAKNTVLVDELKRCLELYEEDKENNSTKLNESAILEMANSPLKVRDVNSMFFSEEDYFV